MNEKNKILVIQLLSLLNVFDFEFFTYEEIKDILQYIAKVKCFTYGTNEAFKDLQLYLINDWIDTIIDNKYRKL